MSAQRGRCRAWSPCTPCPRQTRRRRACRSAAPPASLRASRASHRGLPCHQATVGRAPAPHTASLPWLCPWRSALAVHHAWAVWTPPGAPWLPGLTLYHAWAVRPSASAIMPLTSLSRCARRHTRGRAPQRRSRRCVAASCSLPPTAAAGWSARSGPGGSRRR